MPSGSVAVVTGASQGLGRAIALELVRRRVSVIGVARSAERLEQVRKDSLGEARGQAQFLACPADITTESGIGAIKARVDACGLALIALVNNAGTIQPLQAIAVASADDWRAHFDVGFFAALELAQALMSKLSAYRGRIINVSSGAATHAYAGWGAYCASKAALNMLTQSLSVEEPRVVSVAVRPGVVDTMMQDYIRDMGAQQMLPQEYAKFTELKETGRLLPPEKPALAIARLAIEADRALSGRFLSWDDPALEPYRDPTYPDMSPALRPVSASNP
ncbi:hypothetical protein GGF46_004303 [Coemansia sp. RSA 552]|nr:hypothetical protein GGF46_004303 [Coemansia sp. RSA 552]